MHVYRRSVHIDVLNKHTCIHTYMHDAYIHTYIHTYIYMYMYSAQNRYGQKHMHIPIRMNE